MPCWLEQHALFQGPLATPIRTCQRCAPPPSSLEKTSNPKAMPIWQKLTMDDKGWITPHLSCDFSWSIWEMQIKQRWFPFYWANSSCLKMFGKLLSRRWLFIRPRGYEHENNKIRFHLLYIDYNWVRAKSFWSNQGRHQQALMGNIIPFWSAVRKMCLQTLFKKLQAMGCKAIWHANFKKGNLIQLLSTPPCSLKNLQLLR